VQPRFTHVSGRVEGFGIDEVSRVSVGFLQPGDQAARIAPVGEDGAFEFTGVSLGRARLSLLLAGESGRATVLAILPIDVESEVQGVVLARDPSSLPPSADRDD